MHVVIAGGTGFIGRRLVEELVAAGHRITVVRRSGTAGKPVGANVRAVAWGHEMEASIDGADAVVNLAGEPIAESRWTPRRKELLMQSRLDTTQAIVSALKAARQKPTVLINGSAVGYYGTSDRLVDETASPGSDFLARVCTAWEGAARQAEGLGIRVVLLRTGVVLGKGGGALPRMMLPFKLLAGGPLGSGKQPFPWIHLDDVVGLIRFALENSAVSGPVNAVAPQTLTNGDFSKALGRAMGRPSWLPAPALALKLALGEMAEAMLLNGQRVEPAAAGKHGYRFQHPRIDSALSSFLGS
ncbi:MAG: TIGR01777 family oxidoreductase [Bacillota bacterium]